MNFRLLFSIAAIFLSAVFFAKISCADEPIYTWEECVEIARKNNAELQSALATEKQMKALEGVARANYFPQLTATSNSGRSYTNSGNLASSNSFFYTTNTVSLSASQNIFNGFQDQAKIEQAKANSMVATANIATIKAKISYDLKNTFSSFTYAKSYTKLLEEIIKRRRDNLKIVDLRFKGGMENKGSLLLARAYLDDAEYNFLQAQNLKNTARAQLCKAMGLSDCTPFDIKNSITIKSPPKNLEFEKIVLQMPQHAQAAAQEKASRAGVIIAESAFLPIVNLTALSGQRGTTYLPQNDYWSVGLNISLPFYTGGRDYFSTISASENRLSATHNRETVDRQALADLKQYYASYIENVAKLKVSASFKDAAQMRAEIARNKYNNGLLTFEDWDVIESDLINRQTTYLQNQRDRVISEAAWENIQGIGVFSE